MSEETRRLEENELKEVSGGTHLSCDEIDGLKVGDRLLYESDEEFPLALVEYMGEYRDDGKSWMREIKVKIVEIYNGYPKVDSGHYGYVGVNDVTWISRWNIDFLDRANK